MMEVPVCPGPLHLNHSGLIWNRFDYEHKGDYIITDRKHNGRPVYGNKDKGYVGNSFFLYSEEDGTWTVEGAYVGGGSTPEMKSTTAASCPALCQDWLYTGNSSRGREGGGPPWKKGDITLSCKIHSQ